MTSEVPEPEKSSPQFNMRLAKVFNDNVTNSPPLTFIYP